MSIIVDPRRGSGEFAKLLGRFSIPVFEEYLEFGDFAFAGNGHDGDCSVGVERKALGDFLTCMDDSRFVGHQLPGLLETYHFTFLMIEGVYRPAEDGFIEQLMPTSKPNVSYWARLYVGKKSVLYSQVAGHLNTLRLKAGAPNAGLAVIQTFDKLHTTYEVAHLYRWFQKPWEEHRSHIGFYDPVSMFRTSSSFERRVAMQLDGIGFDRSAAIESKFPGTETMSPMEEMMAATEKDWESIPGVGKLSAEKIYRQLHRRNEVKEPKKTRKKKNESH